MTTIEMIAVVGIGILIMTIGLGYLVAREISKSQARVDSLRREAGVAPSVSVGTGSPSRTPIRRKHRRPPSTSTPHTPMDTGPSAATVSGAAVAASAGGFGGGGAGGGCGGGAAGGC